MYLANPFFDACHSPGESQKWLCFLQPGTPLMLSERQLSLLERLENQNLTMKELASGGNVSSRTVLRDIDYLNFTLSDAARISTNGSGYQLDIFDRNRYFMQLQRHDNDDKMLFVLLTNLYTTRLQLAEALNLPEKIVNDQLARLKQRSSRCFRITSRPNSGHYIDEPRRKKLIILANLIKKAPSAVCASLNLESRVFQLLRQNIEGISDNSEYCTTLLLAVYALRNQKSPSVPAGNSQTFHAAYEAAGLYLSHDALKEADSLVKALQDSASQVTTTVIGELTNELLISHGLGELDQQLIDDLTAHIARCAARPLWLQESRQGSMNNLKAAWPVAFDLSIGLINQIRQRLNIEIYDSDLIGLYFACALERNQGEKHTIVLLAEQNAIATINQLAIERELHNCRVVIALHPAELYALCEEMTPALIINNSAFPLDTLVAEMLVIKNIINPAGINLVKEKLDYSLIKQKLPQFIPEECSFVYANTPGDQWLTIIKDICARLVKRGLLNKDDAHSVYQRETEGENLVVNHIAIPHCWSESSNQFRSYFICLKHPVMINGESVAHLLLACTSTALRQELKIFSYLANALNRYDAHEIERIRSYPQFMALLCG